MVRATAIWRVLMVMLTLCAAFYSGCSSGDTQSKALPIIPLDEIESIYVHREFNAPSFMVPKDRWAAVLSSISPYKKDPDPAKWTVYRDVTVTLKNSKVQRLFLFHGPGKAAFAMGKSWEDRTYYLGGSKERLFEAIESAANVAELELPEMPVEGLKDIRVVPGYESDASNSFGLTQDSWRPFLASFEPRQYNATSDPQWPSKALYAVILSYEDGRELKLLVFPAEGKASYAVNDQKGDFWIYFNGGQHNALMEVLDAARAQQKLQRSS
jgi:hypothetical protein